jgi:nucleotide-binding universal stress UspA family protein
MAVSHIMVGVDGSIPSIQALRWGVALAREVGAHIQVVHGFEPVQSEKPPGVLERLIDEAAQQVHEWCDGELVGIDAELRAIPGDPRALLPELVRQSSSDLLVMSSLGASGVQPGLFRFGSVTESVVRLAPTVMAVIPPTQRVDAHAYPMRRVMLCNDGSAHGQAAVQWLRTVETQRGQTAEVIPVFVDPYGIDASSSVDQEILLMADAHEADTIVMGTRGAGGLSALRLGSVALGVVRYTRTPVVLVPPA